MKITQKSIDKIDYLAHYIKYFMGYVSYLFFFTYAIMGMSIIHGNINHFTTQKMVNVTAMFSIGIVALSIIIRVVIDFLRKSFSFPKLIIEMFAYLSVVYLLKYTSLNFQVNTLIIIIAIYMFLYFTAKILSEIKEAKDNKQEIIVQNKEI